MIRLSCVVPCYNETDNIEELYRRLSAACRSAGGPAYEIILINDGSQDGTWQIEKICDTDPHVVGIDSFDPLTGKPSNYGVARFDLAARSVINSNGDVLASGVEAAADDWVKVWVDLRSRDGEVFVTIGLLESPGNLHVFKSAGQEMTFGGFKIFSRR